MIMIRYTVSKILTKIAFNHSILSLFQADSGSVADFWVIGGQSIRTDVSESCLMISNYVYVKKESGQFCGNMILIF